VAGGAARREGVTPLCSLAVQAGVVLTALALVAGGALDTLVGERLDVVSSMAPGTGWSSAAAASCYSTVQATSVLLGLAVVTHPAVDRLDLRVVEVLSFEVGMARDAFEITVK